MSEVQDHVWLNGVSIPINGPVVWDKVTPFPDQITTSEPTEADFQPVSKQRWSDLRKGAGKDKKMVAMFFNSIFLSIDAGPRDEEKWSQADNDRYWDADGVDASQTTQTLAPLVTTLASFGAAPVKILKHDGKIWAFGHNVISSWNGAAWTSHKTDFANPTDAILFYGDTA